MNQREVILALVLGVLVLLLITSSGKSTFFSIQQGFQGPYGEITDELNNNSEMSDETIPAEKDTKTRTESYKEYKELVKEVVKEADKRKIDLDDEAAVDTLYQEKVMEKEGILKEELKKYQCDMANGAYACGPFTLKLTLKKFDIDASSEELNAFRNNGGGFLRDILSLFSEEARQITWPKEMKTALEHYGLEVTKIQGSNKLNKADEVLQADPNAVILTRVEPKGETFKHHWNLYKGNNKFNDNFNIGSTITRNTDGSVKDVKIKEIPLNILEVNVVKKK